MLTFFDKLENLFLLKNTNTYTTTCIITITRRVWRVAGLYKKVSFEKMALNIVKICTLLIIQILWKSTKVLFLDYFSILFKRKLDFKKWILDSFHLFHSWKNRLRNTKYLFSSNFQWLICGLFQCGQKVEKIPELNYLVSAECDFFYMDVRKNRIINSITYFYIL